MKAKSILASIVVVLFAIGCGSGDDTNGTGTADSGNEIQLTFDGDSCVGAMPSDCSRTCVYEGATELPAGPITLTFINATDEHAFVEIGWLTGDETAQDVIDYIGEEPTGKFHPYWTEEVAFSFVEPGDTFVWVGELEPAIHNVVCGMPRPNRVWLGSVFTVTG
jgi:hypothetical protein